MRLTIQPGSSLGVRRAVQRDGVTVNLLVYDSPLLQAERDNRRKPLLVDVEVDPANIELAVAFVLPLLTKIELEVRKDLVPYARGRSLASHLDEIKAARRRTRETDILARFPGLRELGSTISSRGNR